MIDAPALDWHTQAACSGMTDLFFSHDKDERAAAKAICRDCPVWVECDQWARANRPSAGIWAGRIRGGKAR